MLLNFNLTNIMFISDKKLGIINATKSVWQQESFYGFWRGLSPVSTYLPIIFYILFNTSKLLLSTLLYL